MYSDSQLSVVAQNTYITNKEEKEEERERYVEGDTRYRSVK